MYVYIYIYIYIVLFVFSFLFPVSQKQTNTTKSRPHRKAGRNPWLVTCARARQSRKRCVVFRSFWSADQGGIAIEVCLVVPKLETGCAAALSWRVAASPSDVNITITITIITFII